MSLGRSSCWKRYSRDGKDAALGEGRYGRVVRAVDNETGDIVAIKIVQMDVSRAANNADRRSKERRALGRG